MTVIWRPEPLTARLKAAVGPAARAWAAAAQARAPGNIRIVVSVSGTTARVSSPNREAIFVEQGTRAHEITPKRRVLKLADGRFVTGPVQHPGMRARPFLRPLLPSWASLYRQAASGAFRGF